jgi:hypothetical protein
MSENDYQLLASDFELSEEFSFSGRQLLAVLNELVEGRIVVIVSEHLSSCQRCLWRVYAVVTEITFQCCRVLAKVFQQHLPSAPCHSCQSYIMESAVNL